MKHLRVNDKVRVESIEPSMAEIVFNTIERDRQYLREWLPFIDATINISDTEAFINNIVRQKEKRKDDVFAIWYQEEFAGLIGFKDTDWMNRKTEIGYWLAQPMQGKGIISACVSCLMRFAYNKMGMNRVQIKVAKGNLKSESIPSRLNFYYEGTEREGELIHGKFHDLKVFSLLKSDLKLHSGVLAM
jgi:ribosomal-protein-serine acetyltransferase